MHEKKMDKDWIKAVTQLCVIAQNSEESMQESIHYLHIMQREYGIDENVFHKIYDEWRKRGEVTEEYMPADARMRKVPLYHRGAEGMCRMLDEGVVEEKMFFSYHLYICKKSRKITLPGFCFRATYKTPDGSTPSMPSAFLFPDLLPCQQNRYSQEEPDKIPQAFYLLLWFRKAFPRRFQKTSEPV